MGELPPNTVPSDFTPLTKETATALAEDNIAEIISDMATADTQAKVDTLRHRLNGARVIAFLVANATVTAPVEPIGTSGATMSIPLLDTVTE